MLDCINIDMEEMFACPNPSRLRRDTFPSGEGKAIR